MPSKGNPCVLLMGRQIGAATAKSSMELPQKIKNGPGLVQLGALSTGL